MDPEPDLPEVLTVAETGSTQRDLLAAAVDADRWPHLSGIRAVRQLAGRGRGDRQWDTDDLSALTVSLVLRPAVAAQEWPWVPMLVGRAVVEELAALGVAAGLKWPNDVVVPAEGDMPGWGAWRKVGGILAEVLADGSGIVVGLGINLDGSVPVAWASTLRDQGVDIAPGDLLDGVRSRLRDILASEVGTWRDGVASRCITVGTNVRAELPGGAECSGTAVGLDEHGGLLIEQPDGSRFSVMAGDVEHLRDSGQGR